MATGGAGGGCGAGGAAPTTALMVALYPDLNTMVFDKDVALNFVFVVDRCVCAEGRGVCAAAWVLLQGSR